MPQISMLHAHAGDSNPVPVADEVSATTNSGASGASASTNSTASEAPSPDSTDVQGPSEAPVLRDDAGAVTQGKSDAGTPEALTKYFSVGEQCPAGTNPPLHADAALATVSWRSVCCSTICGLILHLAQLHRSEQGSQSSNCFRILKRDAGGAAWPQWTGPSARIIGVPGSLQSLYSTVPDGFYNASSQEYTLRFQSLPEDLSYCSQPTEVAEVRAVHDAIIFSCQDHGACSLHPSYVKFAPGAMLP